MLLGGRFSNATRGIGRELWGCPKQGTRDRRLLSRYGARGPPCKLICPVQGLGSTLGCPSPDTRTSTESRGRTVGHCCRNHPFRCNSSKARFPFDVRMSLASIQQTLRDAEPRGLSKTTPDGTPVERTYNDPTIS